MISKKLLIIFIFTLYFSGILAQTVTCKQVIGYYPNWQWYDRAKLVNPESIMYEKYTIINYAFFSPQTDGSIDQTDTWADDNLLLGEPIWYPTEGHDFTTSIIYLAHAENCKVMASVGGWTLSNNFPAITADPAKREIFISDCIALIDSFQFDGIDIDWEYPGFAEHSGTTADKANFTVLMQELRNALNEHETLTGDEYMLTACFSADPLKMENIEYSNLIDILDYFNMMTYDFSGTYDAIANHNSPLFAPAQGDPEWNLDRTFYNVTTVHGVPADKVNLGVAFYGRSMTGCSGLFGSHSGSANTVLFAADEGTPLYFNILANIDQFTYNWDDQAKVPYLTNGPDNTFVTYDNEESVRLKGEYITENEAAGAIIWEITGDYVETTPGSGVIGSTPLIDALNEGLCTEVGINNPTESEIKPLIYASSNSEINVLVAMEKSRLTVYTINGVKVYDNKLKKGLNKIILQNQKPGVFLFVVQTSDFLYSERVFIE
ncbi:MAG: hypothetical protein A2W91_08900 [Bacteroidetes bacterium GWF2_38_335]|nr:MAG: hypothetical protein A2W91_08900 [Bacteroidetes bacterium GWF2_38_335]OFY80490.1 MAG: hypothetical protein A2281_08625 [Bacteroidetes bacterium RIFOXYA12_FULL_38_20]HBS85901.1 hypothetical protein [Bacteroidales bacterium]